ncbi:cadherin-like beta sandwich domain-containing protein [Paenibacillus sp. CC-CFT747]|nr:cadherin-like beta sandwich domain-containing protein [Paenibacillus sp. CC-CFT747]
MAHDNTDIDRYVIYRGTVSGFTPGPESMAGTARGQSFSDTGLLPNTTYFYKVAAKDLKGNIGPASKEVYATTADTSLRPLILTNLFVSYTGSSAAASMRAVDPATGNPVPAAAIEGRFTYAGGKYTSGVADATGRITLTSEAIPSGRQVGFEPRRVAASGYYWAQAYDRPHTTALYPQAGLSGLSLSAGSLSPLFSTNTTRYMVTVPASTSVVAVTPTVAVPGSTVEVNGKAAASGQATQPIPLAVGDNTVFVIVTGPDGFKDTYNLTVTRDVPIDNEFRAAEDTYVFENAPTANYGSAETLDIADVPRAAGGGDRMSYLKFDLAGYTDPVQTVVMRVYVPTPPSAPLDVHAAGFDGDNWSEQVMNWNNRLLAGTQPLGTLHVTKAGWYSMDVTNFIKNQLALDKKATIRLMDPNTRNLFVSVSSRENLAFAPYLILNPSSDATLTLLTTSQGELSPEYSSGVFDYSVKLARHQSNVRVTPVTAESHALISVNDKPVKSGQASDSIPLAEGSNVVTIRVTAQDGIIQTYTITYDNPPDDTTPPVTTALLDGTYRDGWFSSDVTVRLTSSDDLSGVDRTEFSLDSGHTWRQYASPVAVTEEGTRTVMYRSIDRAGNGEATQSVSIAIDKTAPEITIIGAGEYTIDQTVLITCTASDTVSGVTYSSCSSPLVNAPAYQLPLGTHTITAQAENGAGLTGSVSTEYTIRVTRESLINLIRQWLWNPEEEGLAQSLHVKLQQGKLDAFVHEAEAQKGKKLSESRAELLIKFVKALE